MTTLTRFFGFDGIHYMWVHSRPYTKRMRTRLARGVIAQVPALISRWLHFPHWIGVVLVLPALVYLLYTLLAFLGDDIGWEQRQRDEKLAALHSPEPSAEGKLCGAT